MRISAITVQKMSIVLKRLTFFLLVKENHQQCWWFQKALVMPSPAAAACLLLMREVDSPQAKTEGEKQEEKIFSHPVFCFAKASPLVRGDQEKLQTASAVVRQDTQVKDHSMSL